MSKGQYSVQELATLLGVPFEGDPSFVLTGVDEITTATKSDCTFLSNDRYAKYLEDCEAGLICISPNTERPKGRNYLLTPHPSDTFQKLLGYFLEDPTEQAVQGIHPTATVEPTAQLGENVRVGPYSYIGPNVQIGNDVEIYAQVTIQKGCVLEDRVIIQPGCVIGACGFGYTLNAQGEHEKLTHYGNVHIEADVEIGANTVIQRARFKSTRIQKGTKMGDLCCVGHNCDIGPYNVIVSQTGFSGSIKTGRYVKIGGQAGFCGHISIGDQASIAAQSGVTRSVPPGAIYRGTPARPIDQFHRSQIHLKHLDKYLLNKKKS